MLNDEYSYNIKDEYLHKILKLFQIAWIDNDKHQYIYTSSLIILPSYEHSVEVILEILVNMFFLFLERINSYEKS